MAARLNRSAGFVAVTAMLVLFMAAAGAPTPLYVVYQQQWGFPTSTLTWSSPSTCSGCWRPSSSWARSPTTSDGARCSSRPSRWRPSPSCCS